MTTRSLFKIEQIEKRLQEYAHQIPKFKSVKAEVGSDHIEINFYYSKDGKPYRIHVHGATSTGRIEKWGNLEWEEQDYWGFTIEPKDYMDTPHATKVSGEDKKGLEWLNKLMEGIEAEPRFKLSGIEK